MQPIGLKVDDARKALGGLSRATLYRLVNKGEIELVRIGGRSLITTQSIETALSAARKEAGYV